MNKCILIGDLLPLYIEDMLSEESKKLVEEHIAECPSCKMMYDALQKDAMPEALPPEREQKEKTVAAAINSYRKWFYSLLIAVIISSLLGGIIGTYTVLKYEELIPTNVARDFVTYALSGDRWVYQEKISEEVKNELSFDQYFDWKDWEDAESSTKDFSLKGFKVYKNITTQEFGPIDVSLKVGLVLTKDGFKVFKVTINDKENYLKKKEAFLSDLNKKGDAQQGDVYNIELPPANPQEGEYFVEGRILDIQGNQIHIEQHYDTGSKEVSHFTIGQNTLIVKHTIINHQDYFDKIDIDTLKVGDVIAIIFTKEDTPRAVILTD